MSLQAKHPGPIRILFAERRPVLSRTTRLALTGDPGLQIVGQAASAVEATRLSRAELPHIAICESTLPEPGAVELARFYRVRMPATRVVFISPQPTDDELFEAARVGVAAYFPSTVAAETLLSALRRVHAGEYLIDEEVVLHPRVAVRILAQFRTTGAVSQAGLPSATSSPPPGRTDTMAPLFLPISPRELEIVDLVARGNSNKLIARQLGISDQTVKNHITTILRKLEVNDRTEAVVTALRNGWIRIDAAAPARSRN